MVILINSEIHPKVISTAGRRREQRVSVNPVLLVLLGVFGVAARPCLVSWFQGLKISITKTWAVLNPIKHMSSLSFSSMLRG